MARREYPPEFRRQIIELHKAGRSVAELAREFEPGEQTIRNWIRQAEIDDGEPEGRRARDREELRRLRRENRQLKLEREILKKKPRPGLLGRATRSPDGIRVHEATPGHLSGACQGACAGALRQRLLPVAQPSTFGSVVAVCAGHQESVKSPCAFRSAV